MFETKVVLKNQHDEIICELEKDGMWYKFPIDFAKHPCLDIGDEYRIEEIEMYWYLDDEGKNWEIEYDNTDGVWYKKEVNY